MTTKNTYFEVPEATEGQIIKLEVYVTDRVSNKSGALSDSFLIPEEEEAGPIESEEDQDKEEEEEAQEPFEGVSEKSTSEPSSEGKRVTPLLAEGAVVCENHYGDPHPSSHKRTRVNVVTSSAARAFR
jgi:regulator of replication initiation timing